VPFVLLKEVSRKDTPTHMHKWLNLLNLLLRRKKDMNKHIPGYRTRTKNSNGHICEGEPQSHPCLEAENSSLEVEHSPLEAENSSLEVENSFLGAGDPLFGVGDPLFGVGDPHSHTHTNTKAVLNRLSRAIGHLTAVRGMVEQGYDCSQVLIQLAAVRSAIHKTCEVILKDHLEHCIVDAIKTGDREALEKLKRAVELLMK